MENRINPIQAMVNGMSADWQKQRSETQMTLGKLIKQLETMPKELMVKGLGELDSYRGYYSDLAFQPSKDEIAVEHLLGLCREAMGKIYQGYKGGDYLMGETTPLWVAPYGGCGDKLMGINDNG